MHHLSNSLLKGVAAVLPIALTLYLIYWLALTIERAVRPLLVLLLSEAYYVPGMGFVAGLVLLYLIGLLGDAWLFQQFFRLGRHLIERIPLVKTLYKSLRDFVNYFSLAKSEENLNQVVLVTIADAHLIGFQTGDERKVMGVLPLPDDIVAIYLPMSYQVGGYTLYVPRSWVEPVDLSMEEAIRIVFTAGLGGSTNGKDTGDH